MPDRATVLARVSDIRPLDAVLATEGAFKGTATELLRSVMADPEQSFEARLACAHSLARSEPPAETGSPLDKLTVAQIEALLALSRELRERQQPPLLEAEPTEGD